MKAASILNHESTFQSSGLDSFGKKFILTDGTYPIKGTAETIKIKDYARENGDKSFLYPEDTAKKRMTDAGFKNFTGIVRHVNCRTDKVDIEPAFDWGKVIQGVNS